MIMEISKKVCMLGAFGVGKTSLVRRFIYNLFDEKYMTTIGVQVSHKQLESILKPHSKTPVRLKIILWDLAHIEKINEIIKNYFRGSHGAIVVFDITRPQTFSFYNEFINIFLEINPKSSMIFVANKIDLVTAENQVDEQFIAMTQQYLVPHFYTSAKTGKNIENAFNKLGQMLIEA